MRTRESFQAPCSQRDNRGFPLERIGPLHTLNRLCGKRFIRLKAIEVSPAQGLLGIHFLEQVGQVGVAMISQGRSSVAQESLLFDKTRLDADQELSLYSARLRTQIQQGRVEYRVKADAGSRFGLWLPAAKAAGVDVEP